MTLAPGRPNRVMVALTNQIIRSDDRGASWRLLPVAPAGSYIWIPAFAADQSRPDTLFVTSRPSTGAAAWKTDDAGETWRPIATPSGQMDHVVVDPTAARTLFAPGSVRTLAAFVQLDPTASAVRYATFLDGAVPQAVTVDPSGAIYAIPSNSYLTVTKLQPPDATTAPQTLVR